MIVQIKIEDTQSDFFLDLLNHLRSSVLNIEILENKKSITENNVKMKYLSENGFSKNILADKNEDVWNDI